MSQTRRWKWGLLACPLLASCATTHAPKQANASYNFHAIKRVALGTFAGQGGEAVSHEFVKQLVASGFIVTDQKQTADAALSGVVTDYRPLDKKLVFIGAGKFPGAKDQPVEVTNPIVNSAVPTDISALELPKIQVVTLNASVSVIVNLHDVKTGALLWTNAASYEGLTMDYALPTMTGMLVHALRALIYGAAVPA